MRRLVAEISRGPHVGQLVYKPLTEDARGIAWLERTLLALRIAPPPVSTGHMTACLDALVGVEALATVYHYLHAEGVFVTIRMLRRGDRS